jgi:hypothetical protein
MTNGAIDAVVKRWKRLAHVTGCAIMLVHHSKKLAGMAVTAEDGRGASALHGAARVVLTLNRMSEDEAKKLGIDLMARKSFVRIDLGKSNRAPPGVATWVKLAGQSLGNATNERPADEVAVATIWTPPDVHHGITPEHRGEVLRRLAIETHWRESSQASDWVGKLIAEVAGLDYEKDKLLLQNCIKAWISDGHLVITRQQHNGKPVPFVIAGKPNCLKPAPPHPPVRDGAEGAGMLPNSQPAPPAPPFRGAGVVVG